MTAINVAKEYILIYVGVLWVLSKGKIYPISGVYYLSDSVQYKLLRCKSYS